jgi:hypothetical protein
MLSSQDFITKILKSLNDAGLFSHVSAEFITNVVAISVCPGTPVGIGGIVFTGAGIELTARSSPLFQKNMHESINSAVPVPFKMPWLAVFPQNTQYDINATGSVARRPCKTIDVPVQFAKCEKVAFQLEGPAFATIAPPSSRKTQRVIFP